MSGGQDSRSSRERRQIDYKLFNDQGKIGIENCNLEAPIEVTGKNMKPHSGPEMDQASIGGDQFSSSGSEGEEEEKQNVTTVSSKQEEKIRLLQMLETLEEKEAALEEETQIEKLKQKIAEKEKKVKDLDRNLKRRKDEKKEKGGNEMRILKEDLHHSTAAAFAQEITVNILSDSIAKYVSGIRKASIVAFPGINVSRLTARIQRNTYLISKPFTIFHVGTNDINNLSETELISDYNNLITVVRNMSRTTMLFSSILPRPVDFERTNVKVKEVNRRLKVLCKERQVHFIHSFRSFFKGGKPCRELFAVRDGGLHLNSEGTRRLRLVFVNTVAHLT